MRIFVNLTHALKHVNTPSRTSIFDLRINDIPYPLVYRRIWMSKQSTVSTFVLPWNRAVEFCCTVFTTVLGTLQGQLYLCCDTTAVVYPEHGDDTLLWRAGNHPQDLVCQNISKFSLPSRPQSCCMRSLVCNKMFHTQLAYREVFYYPTLLPSFSGAFTPKLK
jgi:hypothetical protein